MTDLKDNSNPMDTKANTSSPNVDVVVDSDATSNSFIAAKTKSLSFHLTWILLLVLLISIVSTTTLWQKLGRIQSQLAKQNQESNEVSKEAKLLAKTSTEVSQEVAAKQALLEAKIAELASEKAQIDELMQTVSRSRVESLVIDIESSLNLAQQQSALTGSVEPIVITLQTAQQRISRSPSPRLASLEAAMRRDLDRARAVTTLDTPNLLIKLDDATRLVQTMPLVTASLDNQHIKANTQAVIKSEPKQKASKNAKLAASVASSAELNSSWYEYDWSGAWRQMKNQISSLVRISPIDYPEAALLTPDQAFFIRENLKLHLLNVRMAILSRQFNLASADLNRATELINKYFDPNSKQAQVCSSFLLQINSQLKTGKLPTVTDSLNASSALLGTK